MMNPITGNMSVNKQIQIRENPGLSDWVKTSRPKPEIFTKGAELFAYCRKRLTFILIMITLWAIEYILPAIKYSLYALKCSLFAIKYSSPAFKKGLPAIMYSWPAIKNTLLTTKNIKCTFNGTFLAVNDDRSEKKYSSILLKYSSRDSKNSLFSAKNTLFSAKHNSLPRRSALNTSNYLPIAMMWQYPAMKYAFGIFNECRQVTLFIYYPVDRYPRCTSAGYYPVEIFSRSDNSQTFWGHKNPFKYGNI
jgi:hypothetical protein